VLKQLQSSGTKHSLIAASGSQSRQDEHVQAIHFLPEELAINHCRPLRARTSTEQIASSQAPLFRVQVHPVARLHNVAYSGGKYSA
jgi:hypothetical protein